MKKVSLHVYGYIKELFAAADVADVPVLLNKGRVHDSIAAATGSLIMAGRHMRDCAAEFNLLFKVKKQQSSGLTVLRIKKAIRRNGRSWKHRKV